MVCKVPYSLRGDSIFTFTGQHLTETATAPLGHGTPPDAAPPDTLCISDFPDVKKSLPPTPIEQPCIVEEEGTVDDTERRELELMREIWFLTQWRHKRSEGLQGVHSRISHTEQESDSKSRAKRARQKKAVHLANRCNSSARKRSRNRSCHKSDTFF